MNANKLPDPFFPYLVSGSFPTSETVWKFLIPQGSFEIKNKTEILKRLLPLCLGNLSLDEILEHFEGIERIEAEKLFIILFKRGAIAHVNQIYNSLGNFGSNPRFIGHLEQITHSDEEYISHSIGKSHTANENKRIFKEETGTFGEILENRKSSRDFSGIPLTRNELLALCWSLYGKLENGKRVVPSGGAFYPLKLFICVLIKCEDFEPGIYLWNPNENCLELNQAGDFLESVKELYAPDTFYAGAAISFYLFANLSRSSRKYSNAAYRFAILEAGHALQNGYLFCAQNNLKIIEIGGNSCSATNKFLGLKEGEDLSIISGQAGR